MNLDSYIIERSLNRHNTRYHVTRRLDGRLGVMHLWPGPRDGQERERLQQAWRTWHNVSIVGLAELLSLFEYGEQTAVIFERCAGLSATKLIAEQGPLPLRRALRVCAEVAKVLSALHQRHLVHGALTSQAIRVEAQDDDDVVVVTSPMVFTRSGQEAVEQQLLPKRLPYLAPAVLLGIEASHTRHDLFALGVMLFEWLVGHTPWRGDDPLRLRHAILTQEPENLPALDQDPNQCVQRMLHELLTPEAWTRPWTAQRVAVHIQGWLRCLEQGHELKSRANGHHNASALRWPGHRYGQERARQGLRKAIEATASRQRVSQAVVLAGPVGVGKSALAHEAQRICAQVDALFIRTACQPNEGFEAFARGVLRSVVQAVMELDPVSWAKMRDTIAHTLGDALVELSAVEPLVGILSAATPTAEPSAHRHVRAALVMWVEQLLFVVCNARSRSLVLFVDDVGWADARTVRFLADLIALEPDVPVCVVATFSDHCTLRAPWQTWNEAWGIVDEGGHPLSAYPVTGLTEIQVAEVLRRLFGRSHEACCVMARWVWHQTRGNPLALRLWLQTWMEQSGTREARIDALEEAARCASPSELGASPSVVDIIADALDNVDPQHTCILSTAACFRQGIDVPLLAQAVEMPDVEQVIAILERWRSSRVLRWTHGQYMFREESFRALALALASEQEQAMAHARLGHALRRCALARGLQGHSLMEVAHHAVRSTPEAWCEVGVEGDDTRVWWEVWRAAQVACRQMRLERALDYAEYAYQALEHKAIEVPDEVAMDVLRTTTWLLGGMGAMDRAARLLERRIDSAEDPLEWARLQSLRVIISSLQGHYDDALMRISTTIVALGQAPLPEHPTSEAYHAERTHIDGLLKEIGGAAALTQHHRMTDPALLLCTQLLAQALPVTYVSHPSLFPLVVCRLTRLSLEFGLAPDSGRGLSTYGQLLATEAGDDRMSLALGEAFLTLSRHDPMAKHTRQIACSDMANYIMWRTQPLRESARYNNEGKRAALEVGDMQYAGYIRMHDSTNAYLEGQPLEDVHALALKRQRFCRRLSNALAQEVLWALIAAIEQGWWLHPNAPTSASAPNLSHGMARCIYHMVLAHASVVHGRWLHAWRELEEALTHRVHVEGWYPDAELDALAALILAGGLRHGVFEPESVEQLTATLEHHHRALTDHARRGPDNFHHRLLQVQAMQATEPWEALRLWDEAIEAARLQGFLPHEAFAREQAGRLWIERGRAAIGQQLLRDAIRLYRRWSTRLEPPLSRDATLLPLAASHASSSAPLWDQRAILLWCRSISQAQSSEAVLEACVRGAMLYSGADRGLIVERNAQGDWTVVMVCDNTQDSVYVPATVRFSPEPFWDEALQASGKLLHVHDAESPSIQWHSEWTRNSSAVSCGALAMVHPPFQHDIVLHLENHRRTGIFDALDPEGLEFINAQAAISLQATRQTEALIRRESQWRQRLMAMPIFLADITDASLNVLSIPPSIVHVTQEPSAWATWLTTALTPPLNIHLEHSHPRRITHTLSLPDGATRILEAVTIPDPSEEQAWLWIGWDITERQKLVERTAAVERMEALGRMAGGVAHDFNNMLVIVSMSLQILGAAPRSDAKTDRLLHEAQDALEQATTIAQQLLRFVRGGEHPSLEFIQLAQALESSIALIRHTVPIPITLDADPDLPDVLAGRSLLDRVLLNLCSNAAQATPGLGTIHLRAFVEHGPDPSEPMSEVWSEGAPIYPSVVLEVRDQGHGIAPGHASRLFEPFFTTRSSTGGTGLGLSVVYGIAQQVGARMRVLSRLGEGAAFQLRWPQSP